MSTIREDLVAIKKKIKMEGAKPRFAEERLQYCLICGMICIDSDPTGLTCGQRKCLAELLILYFDYTENLNDIFLKYISNDCLESDINYSNLLFKIKQKLIDLNITMANIAKQLGLGRDDNESKLEYLLEIENELAGDLEGKVPSILRLTQRIAENLSISTEGTLRKILENIKDEIKIIKAETKKLIK